MKDGLYHSALQLPSLPELDVFLRPLNLRYTAHALRAALTDRLGECLPPARVAPTASQLIEVEIRNGKPKKAVVRLPYRAGLDLCLVLVDSDGRSAFVKTLWLNRSEDNHETLRRENYYVLQA